MISLPSGVMCERLADEMPSLGRLAARVATPVYAYRTSVIAEQVRRFASAIGSARGVSVHLHYALLANDNPHIIREIVRLLERHGLAPGLVCASASHIDLVRQSLELSDGFSLVYAGAGMTCDALHSVLDTIRHWPRRVIFRLILGTEGQASMFGEYLTGEQGREMVHALGDRLEVGVRVKLAFGMTGGAPSSGLPDELHNLYHGPRSRFGIAAGSTLRSVVRALRAKGIERLGFHMYPGTNLSSAALLANCYEQFAETVSYVVNAERVTPAFLDIGGGFGINYSDGSVVNPSDIVASVEQIFEPLLTTNASVLIEPGRSIVASAGVLLTRVVDRHFGGGAQHVTVDAGVSHFCRTYVYRQAHRILVLGRGDENESGEMLETFVCGSTMASGDFLAGDPTTGKGVMLPPLQPGDILGILDAGAYGFGMSSSFSGQGQAGEILLSETGSATVIRQSAGASYLRRGIPEWPESV